MRPTIPAIILLVACAAPLRAQNATTAMSAIKLLPKGDAKRIARIEAREGNPTPERWYILVHSPADEAGLREFVVAGGEVVASRTLSQFAETVKAEEVIGTDALRLDSDRVGRLAQQYAVANNVVPATLNFQLRKDADDGTPVWNVTCLDGDGKAQGGIVVAANKEKTNVLSQTGFPVAPGPEKRPTKVDDDDRDREPSRTAPRKRYVVRSRPGEPVRSQPAEKPNFFQRMFGR